MNPVSNCQRRIFECDRKLPIAFDSRIRIFQKEVSFVKNPRAKKFARAEVLRSTFWHDSLSLKFTICDHGTSHSRIFEMLSFLNIFQLKWSLKFGIIGLTFYRIEPLRSPSYIIKDLFKDIDLILI